MKRIISLSLSALILILSLVSYVAYKNSVNSQAYFGRDWAVIRVIDDDGITPTEISDLRFVVDSASTADIQYKGRLWCDSYSYFEKVYISRDSQPSIEANAVVTGGDFFLFHRLNFSHGWYYSDSDLHLDRVVIDSRLAFELFGSSDVEGMKIDLGIDTFYIAGVVESDESEAKLSTLGEPPLIYLPEYIAERIFGKAKKYDCYEVMLQNPVNSHAYNTLLPACEGKTVIDVTSRFDLKNIFTVIRDFPTRSFVTHAAPYPYWENAQRGAEDVLAILLVINALSAVIFIVSLTIFIVERKRK